MKFQLFSRQVSIGSLVTLRLTRGNDVTGQVVELGDTHVIIDAGGKPVTLFEDLLAGWELHEYSPVCEPPADDEETAGQQAPSDISPGSVSPTVDESRSPAPEQVDIDPTTRELRAAICASIEARIEQATLDLPEPDFAFPEEEFPPFRRQDSRIEWNRAKSQYEYAMKVHEISRLSTILAQSIRPLQDSSPDIPAVHHLAGCLRLKLGRNKEAIEDFQRAAEASNLSAHWYGLAAVAERAAETTVCFLALEQMHMQASPDPSGSAWFVYLRLAVRLEDFEGLRDLLSIPSQWKMTPELSRLIGETWAYLLSKIGEERDSLAVVEVLRGTAQLDREVVQQWREFAAKLKGTPNVDLQGARSKLKTRSLASNSTPQPSQKDERGLGHIASFGNLRFGFIESNDGKTLFFRIDDVVDSELRQQLTDRYWPRNVQILFEETPSPGHAYDRAVSVRLFRGTDTILTSALQHTKAGQYSQALGLVRLALRLAPDNQDAQKMDLDLQRKVSASMEEGLPKGSGPYARAKRAQIVEQDFTTADKLFRQAIAQGDNVESAAKDLASLLQQRGRVQDAISLLETHRRKSRSPESFDNMLATMYQHTGDYRNGLAVLKRLCQNAQKKDLPTILRRMAFSQYKAQQYDDAEGTLKRILVLNTDDRTAARWLEAIQEARRVGTYEEADELLGAQDDLADFASQLSSLAEEMVRRCVFLGVEPRKLESGKLTKQDVDRLEELAKELGTRRPRDRAAYYLSAAAILHRYRLDDDDSRFRDYLRRYFASMGDAALADKKHIDLARTYYAESLALSTSAGFEVWRTFGLYLFSFAAPSAVERLVRAQGGTEPSVVRQTFRELNQTRTSFNKMLGAALQISIQSLLASQLLWKVLSEDETLLSAVRDYLECNPSTPPRDVLPKWEDKRRELAGKLRHLAASCGVLTKFQLATASVEDLLTQVRTLDQAILGDLDRQRLSAVEQIGTAALSFSRASDFEERERHYYLVSMQAERLSQDVAEAPTRFSFESLLPVVNHLASLVEERYAEIARTSIPELSLKLVVDSYVPTRSSEIKLQIGIDNRTGSSPASNIEVRLGPPDSAHFSAHSNYLMVAESLRGGASVVQHVPINITQSARDQQAFPVEITARFQNRLGEETTTPGNQYTVRLYDEADFEEVPNRYAPFAEGGAVDEPEMFFGRRGLIDRISASILSPVGTKCFVLFGQKRAGKTSVIERLRQELRESRCLPVSFSLQDIATELNEVSLLYRILQSIRDGILDEPKRLPSGPTFAVPDIGQFTAHPSLLFHELMSDLARQIRSLDEEGRFRLVLLIDEFTEIYKQIRHGRMKREMMKAWKAILEKRYFSCVLVGQDIMPAFKAEFQNEFGVTEDQRITYLSEREARDLIEVPIGADRYRGNAVARILQLTAGSPYYTMTLCSRLVDYMNRTRSQVVTEADIEAVKASFIRGNNPLTKDKFDNLLCAGDGKEDTGIDPTDTFAVCSAIAKGSENGWCPVSSLQGIVPETDRVLLDLEDRDVIERKQDAYRIQVGLFDEWLRVHGQ